MSILNMQYHSETREEKSEFPKAGDLDNKGEIVSKPYFLFKINSDIFYKYDQYDNFSFILQKRVFCDLLMFRTTFNILQHLKFIKTFWSCNSLNLVNSTLLPSSERFGNWSTQNSSRPPVIPTSWYLHLCVILSFWLWVGSGDLPLMNRIQQK